MSTGEFVIPFYLESCLCEFLWQAWFRWMCASCHIRLWKTEQEMILIIIPNRWRLECSWTTKYTRLMKGILPISLRSYYSALWFTYVNSLSLFKELFVYLDTRKVSYHRGRIRGKAVLNMYNFLDPLDSLPLSPHFTNVNVLFFDSVWRLHIKI